MIPEKIITYLLDCIVWIVYLYWRYKNLKLPVKKDIAKEFEELKNNKELQLFIIKQEEMKKTHPESYEEA
jgi:hypothetical protein